MAPVYCLLLKNRLKQAGENMYDQEYLTPEEASGYLRISLESVHKFIQQNELQASPEGHFWKIKRSALEEFLENWGEREELPD